LGNLEGIGSPKRVMGECLQEGICLPLDPRIFSAVSVLMLSQSGRRGQECDARGGLQGEGEGGGKRPDLMR
jgi:hypothetical protein